MLTKFYLHYDDTQYELKDDDLYNWDEIRCSYKRGNFDGVVRSFTSQFVFINRAREIMLSLYLRDRYTAKASISVHTITDHLQWEEKFKCPLDFSTVSWEKYTLKINAIDNSLAALIKANKSTKYEFTVGSEIPRDELLNFDRIPMKESLTYGFTQGISYEDSADITVTFENGLLPWVGNKGHEIVIRGSVDWEDDQTNDNGSYIFKAMRDIDISMSFDLEWRTNTSESFISFAIVISRNGSDIPLSSDINAGSGGIFTNVRNKNYINYGSFTNPDDLPDPNSLTYSEREGGYALFEGSNIVWDIKGNESGYIWKSSGKTVDEYFVERKAGEIPLVLIKGDKVKMIFTNQNPGQTSSTIRFINSSFVFTWLMKGKSEIIDLLRPENVARRLLNRLADGYVNVDVSFSQFDSRLSNTYLIAAESLRGISNARLYSSFNEFCDWMATVFGYVYFIGDPVQSKYQWTRVCGQIEGSPWAYEDEPYIGGINTDNIIYMPGHAKFLYHDEVSGKLYSSWSGSEMYNNPVTGHPRTDTLYQIIELSDTELYYFDEYVSGYLYPNPYGHSEDSIGLDEQTVYFVHRSELLSPSGEIRVVPNCRGVKYSVDTSVIYSSITVGYDKKDYDNINGRDEFNFNNTYSTGCNVSDKTLTLISKYRADSYGMEFAVQKRGANTTDSSSDKDVFFVLCQSISGELIADRTIPIANSLTGAMFNGAFSPMACVRANAGFIGLQAEYMTLRFASSTGNSEIVIDGEPMSADITLNTPLATSGWIEFTTDDVDDIANVDELVEIVDEEGMLYRGYLKEVDVKYAKTEAAKYKLIIKDIEP